MNLFWLGQSCFKIISKDVTLITDPFDKSLGIKPPRTSADIVTCSHEHHDHNATNQIKNNPLIFDTPGEYEAKGVLLRGIESFHDDKQGTLRGTNTIFIIEIENIRICHLGDLGHSLNEEQENKIDGVDILLVPVGGTYTIDGKQAVDVVNQIEPGIVIPMHYKIPGLKIDMANVSKFLKAIGAAKTQPKPKLRVLKKDIPVEGTEVVILNT